MTPHLFTAGDIVAGYTIEAVLGAGGMGTVYRATNPTLPRSDALKILRTELCGDDMFRARFDREATLAATLSHPNIVAVYARGEFEGHLWIAMQYIAGTDADRELHAGTMTAHRAVHIITEVAAALDYAHRRGVLHRDIKPANFLLATESDRDTEPVYLADFGIARARDDTAHLTTDGSVMASVAYAAPEALAGAPIDGRADIYSLGCALFTLLTAKAPFAGRPGGVQSMVAAHLQAPPPRPTDIDPTLPPALDTVIAKAMAKSPLDRYQSARELAEAAAAALATAHTTDVRRSAVTGPFIPENPGQVSAPRPPATTGGPYPPAWMPPNAITYPGTPPPGIATGQPPPPPARRKRAVLIGAATATTVALVAVLAIWLTSSPAGKPYTPQTFTHAHGSTALRTAPRTVATLGPGDTDALLSLGMQPAAIIDPTTPLPSWLHDKLTANPPTLTYVDTTAIAASKPDLIIDTGDIDDATYQKLNTIAPTIARPTTASTWSWRTQLQWIAKIVGHEQQATDLLSKVTSQANDLKTQNSKVAGKTAVVVNISDSAVTETLSPSNAADYLTALGMPYLGTLRRGPADGPTRPVAATTDLYQLDSQTQVLIVTRTDRAAGNGGAAGLPAPLRAYRGTMVIVDDPSMVAALDDPGGYLGTEYLNQNFVPKLTASD
ncbi:serine/threonine-protein kinase [Mycolicibacterium llatzerense]|uniref:serine/threonine-protein kinase n=1 Tax=Mycolicibacterium llatzerense TaxID=280871 RepID=UPI0028CB2315|nr:protein kinase [Mycolicibacterium llatzerense]MCT7371953.1 hypothetical protein [Mycolicibacterium llatzerense]